MWDDPAQLPLRRRRFWYWGLGGLGWLGVEHSKHEATIISSAPLESTDGCRVPALRDGKTVRPCPDLVAWQPESGDCVHTFRHSPANTGHGVLVDGCIRTLNLLPHPRALAGFA